MAELNIFQRGDKAKFIITSQNVNLSHGNYWSASLSSQTCGYGLGFNSAGVDPADASNRFDGFSVRAVQ